MQKLPLTAITVLNDDGTTADVPLTADPHGWVATSGDFTIYVGSVRTSIARRTPAKARWAQS
jgi:hypothetical protein